MLKILNAMIKHFFILFVFHSGKFEKKRRTLQSVLLPSLILSRVIEQILNLFFKHQHVFDSVLFSKDQQRTLQNEPLVLKLFLEHLGGAIYSVETVYCVEIACVIHKHVPKENILVRQRSRVLFGMKYGLSRCQTHL